MTTNYRSNEARAELANIVRKRLRPCNITSDDLAAAIGVGRGRMLALIQGRHWYPLELAAPLADALNLDRCQVIAYTLLQLHPPDTVRILFATIDRASLGFEIPWHLMKPVLGK